MLIEFLKQVRDHRRAQGQRYELHYILLFSIIAMMCGATSFRKIDLFIKTKFTDLKKLYGIEWKKAPSESNIRKIFNNIDQVSLEQEFRNYSGYLNRSTITDGETYFLSCDGKELGGSYNNFAEKKAISCLSVLIPISV